jgi:hypothetical protein
MDCATAPRASTICAHIRPSTPSVGSRGGALLAGNGSLLGVVIRRDEEHPDLGVAIPSDPIGAPCRPPHRPPNHDRAVNAPQRLGAISALVQCSAPIGNPVVAALRSVDPRRRWPQQGEALADHLDRQSTRGRCFDSDIAARAKGADVA